MNDYSSLIPSRDDYASIGELIAQFSVLEASLHMCLKHLLNIEEWQARMLLGEPRLSDLIEMLRKVAARCSLGEKELDILNIALDEANAATKIRAIVAHKPFYREGKALVFYNSITAKTTHSKFEYKCTSEELSNLAKNIALLTLDILVATKLNAFSTPNHIGLIAKRIASPQTLPLPAKLVQGLAPKLPKRPRPPLSSRK